MLLHVEFESLQWMVLLKVILQKKIMITWGGVTLILLSILSSSFSFE